MDGFIYGFALSILWLPLLIVYAVVKQSFAVGISMD